MTTPAERTRAVIKATGDVYGPSLARAPKSFRAEFGDDETLLDQVQDEAQPIALDA